MFVHSDNIFSAVLQQIALFNIIMMMIITLHGTNVALLASLTPLATFFVFRYGSGVAEYKIASQYCWYLENIFIYETIHFFIHKNALQTLRNLHRPINSISAFKFDFLEAYRIFLNKRKSKFPVKLKSKNQ